MKEIIRNSIHVNGKSYDSLFCEFKGKKIRMIYEAYNANELCYVEIFNGDKWNPFLNLLDLGILNEKSAYIWSETKRKQRSDDLFEKFKVMINKIL